MNKRNLVISNLLWRFFERCGSQGITFIVSIILARLLEPETYGTIALVTVFISLLSTFVDSGLGSALIQKKDADDTDFSSVFFFNIFMCSVLYLIMFFTAPLIAKFYNNTELTSVVRVLSLSIIIYALHGIQASFISKNLLFKKFFWSTIFSTVGSAIVGIFLAFSGFGVWALVFQQLTSAFINTLVLWITVPWRPKLLFSFKKLKGLLSFGWKMLVSSLIDKAYNEIRTLIIGKLYSAESLAFYNKGKQFPNQVVSNINASIDSILLPTMAQEQENKNTVKAMMRRAIKTSTYIMAPLMIGLAVCAEPVVRLLLTEKWLDSVFFMRIFCISFVFYPIHTSNLNALKAIGRSDWFLKLEIVKKIIGLSLVIATMFISVEAMAYSVLLSTLLSTMINAYPNKKLLNYSWAEQMKDIMPNILLAVVMGIPVYLLQFLPMPTVVILVVQVLSGAIIYIGLSYILKIEMFYYLLSILKGFLNRGK